MMVDCIQAESNISTLTESVLNRSNANGIDLPVITNNSVLNVESQNTICILQNKTIGSVKDVRQSPEIAPGDTINLMVDEEDKDYEDVLSIEMTDSWNNAVNTNHQLNIEEPTCITNNVTTVCLEMNRDVTCGTKDNISVENCVPVEVMRTENVSD